VVLPTKVVAIYDSSKKSAACVDIFSHLSREEQKIQNSAKNPKFRERAENSKMMSAELTTQKVKALHCKGKATKHRPFIP